MFPVIVSHSLVYLFSVYLFSLPHCPLPPSLACSLAHSLAQSPARPPARPPALSLSFSRSPSVSRRGGMCGRHVTNSLPSLSLALSLTHSDADGCHWGAGAVRDFFESACICCTTVNRDSRRLNLYGTASFTRTHARPTHDHTKHDTT